MRKILIINKNYLLAITDIQRIQHSKKLTFILIKRFATLCFKTKNNYIEITNIKNHCARCAPRPIRFSIDSSNIINIIKKTSSLYLSFYTKRNILGYKDMQFLYYLNTTRIPTRRIYSLNYLSHTFTISATTLLHHLNLVRRLLRISHLGYCIFLSCGHSLYIIATDNFRMLQATQRIKKEGYHIEHRFILNKESISLLCHILPLCGNHCTVILFSAFILLRIGSFTIKINLSLRECFNYSRVLRSIFNQHCTLSTRLLLAAIDHTIIISERSIINFSSLVNKKIIRIASHNFNKEKIIEYIPYLSYPPDTFLNMNIYINPIYMQDILHYTKTDTIDIHYTTSAHMIMISTRLLKYYLMPIDNNLS